MEKSKVFVKNTIILFIGKFATQFMSLLLLPLFTHFLLIEDFGAVDLLQTYITLFIPILTLRVDSAIFRFLIDKRDDENGMKSIISNVFFLLIIGVFITIIGFAILNYFVVINYSKYVILNLIILMISNIFLQLLRGLGKNKEYSIASIITGVATLIINILLIVVFRFNARSILISSSVANLLCIYYVFFKIKVFRYVEIRLIRKKIIKEILSYSLPMIPNSLSWWIVNVSDRTIISMFLGTAFNGIYTVSCKFSNILNSVYSIFNMSWQETATLHINDDDKNEFFTDMINKLFILFSSLAILILVCLPFVYDILIGNDYINSYNYIPILLYANSWNVLIGLIGAIYVAKKKSKEIAATTLVSALINIIINIILIKFIGLYAACVSTLISYFIMSIYRYIDCQKYVKVRLDIKKITIFTALYILSSIIYLINNIWMNIINLVVVIVYSLIVNKYIITICLNFIKNKLSKNE